MAPDGTATHLQSTLICPDAVNGFTRGKLIVYDRVGFDVSCGYTGRRGWITVYLTKLGTTSLQAAFDDAEHQLLQHAPDAVPLPDADQKTFAGAENYLHLTYSEKNGSLWSGIWMADFSGWMFEFRASYAPGAEAEMFDEMAELTRRAADTAASHLALCAKSSVPERDGVALTDEQDIASVGMAVGVAALAGEGEAKDGPKIEKPGVWCAERPIEGFKAPLLLWHAVSAEGKTQSYDQVTLSSYGASPVLQAGTGTAGLIYDEIKSDGKTHYVVTLEDGDDVLVFSIWAGRPGVEVLGHLMQDFLDGPVRILAKVNTKTKSITIYQGPKK